MTLSQELYAVDKGRTLAQNIDKAWDIYKNESSKREDRRVAQMFLIYAFDLKYSNEINQQLLEMMERRNTYKAKNPEYVPGLSPKHLALSPDELLVDKIKLGQTPKNSKLRSLIKKRELLDVNSEDKISDLRDKTIFMSSSLRAQYRVHIHNGMFYHGNSSLNTASYKAHRKRGYGAFTLNANGELSVFTHLGMGNVFHSTMNAGSPVVSAGELIITNGKLDVINTYSGHYKPTLFNIYRTLAYFLEKGVDLSFTKIQTFHDISGLGEKFKSKKISRGFYSREIYEIPATAFLKTVKQELDTALDHIQDDINNYQQRSFKTMVYALKDLCIGSTLTEKRKSIAYKASLVAIKLQEEENPKAENMNEFIESIKKLKIENDTLSSEHGKKSGSGRLSQKLDFFIQRATAIKDLQGPVLDKIDERQLKKLR